MENGRKAAHQEFLLFPHCLKDISYLITGKIEHIFNKSKQCGRRRNASNQLFSVSFFFFFFIQFFLSGIKSGDRLGEESNVEKKKQNHALVESQVKFLFFQNIR